MGRSVWLVSTWLRRGATPVLVACAVVACGSGAVKAQKSDANFADLIGAGTQLLDHGNPSAAAQLFQQAIAKNTKNPVGYYDLGVAYSREGQRHSALTQYAKALHENASYVPALYNYGVAFEQKRPGLAIYFFRKVIEIQPRSPTALLNLGLLIHQGNPKAPRAGLKPLKRAVTLQPSLYAAIPASLREAVRRTKLPKHPKRKPAR